MHQPYTKAISCNVFQVYILVNNILRRCAILPISLKIILGLQMFSLKGPKLLLITKNTKDIAKIGKKRMFFFTVTQQINEGLLSAQRVVPSC